MRRQGKVKEAALPESGEEKCYVPTMDPISLTAQLGRVSMEAKPQPSRVVLAHVHWSCTVPEPCPWLAPLNEESGGQIIFWRWKRKHAGEAASQVAELCLPLISTLACTEIRFIELNKKRSAPEASAITARPHSRQITPDIQPYQKDSGRAANPTSTHSSNPSLLHHHRHLAGLGLWLPQVQQNVIPNQRILFLLTYYNIELHSLTGMWLIGFVLIHEVERADVNYALASKMSHLLIVQIVQFKGSSNAFTKVFTLSEQQRFCVSFILKVFKYPSRTISLLGLQSPQQSLRQSGSRAEHTRNGIGLDLQNIWIASMYTWYPSSAHTGLVRQKVEHLKTPVIVYVHRGIGEILLFGDGFTSPLYRSCLTIHSFNSTEHFQRSFIKADSSNDSIRIALKEIVTSVILPKASGESRNETTQSLCLIHKMEYEEDLPTVILELVCTKLKHHMGNVKLYMPSSLSSLTLPELDRRGKGMRALSGVIISHEPKTGRVHSTLTSMSYPRQSEARTTHHNNPYEARRGSCTLITYRSTEHIAFKGIPPTADKAV
ncbi:uncharacterized protein BDR25DRAFT_360695 [Lindgomyces ingoldianus]|uniref:Uncharacterized protein n=1 Tax=Lindgomyces ingoldianus TaxID=673940 RepID=A0ACB6QFH6_9PLEO|nr:uncharacterized protein BDR25DRAFT_360695 [Lindgomyces ingoldianus]KAF2465338.1 hypothetical protein BDR25DRAFT_360695 [Lindgomyces ingoldianus]